MNLELSVKRGSGIHCVVCGLNGATVGCFRPRCVNIYHVTCAFNSRVMFFQDKVASKLLPSTLLYADYIYNMV